MIAEADMSLTGMAMDQLEGRQDRYVGDDKLLLQFFKQPMQNMEASSKEGRPIFQEVEMIRIMVPGDKTNMIVRPVHDQDKQRFYKAYERWKAGEEEVIDGTPLEQWPIITRAQVEELKFFNIRTVEQLASLSDSQSQKFMGIQMLKRRANDYLESAKGVAVSEELRSELDAKDNEIDTLKQAVEELSARVAAMQEDDD